MPLNSEDFKIKDIRDYATLIFDCDGVVLDSNKVKTEAFYKSALPYGKKFANELVCYHKENGGLSRYIKFEYFLDSILGVSIEQAMLNKLLKSYSENVYDGLRSCQVNIGLKKLRNYTNSRWIIASGGDQSELNEIFQLRNIFDYFDGGIFGSPDTKDTILHRELNNCNIKLPALFLGDSEYDYQSSINAKIDFVFLSDWTEFENWNDYCIEHKLDVFGSLSSLMVLGS
jgi:phosphoglycolate phosphatase-like HAD superfamily hydrolase